jgi:hypothetical protein
MLSTAAVPELRLGHLARSRGAGRKRTASGVVGLSHRARPVGRLRGSAARRTDSPFGSRRGAGRCGLSRWAYSASIASRRLLPACTLRGGRSRLRGSPTSTQNTVRKTVGPLIEPEDLCERHRPPTYLTWLSRCWRSRMSAGHVLSMCDIRPRSRLYRLASIRLVFEVRAEAGRSLDVDQLRRPALSTIDDGCLPR